MDLRLEQLKKMYVATFEDIKGSPLYEIRKMEEWHQIEHDVFVEFEKHGEVTIKLDDILWGEKLLQFKSASGESVYKDIKDLAFARKVEETQKFSAMKEKVQAGPEEVHRFLYLSVRLKILEEKLKKANMRPVLDAKDEIAFDTITYGK